MNYKICVANEAESKEVQGLFFELGYKWIDIGAVYYKISPSFNYITAYCEGKTLAQGHGLDAKKETTIPQLRDMVVLKRNDVGDATHTDGHYSFYVGKDKNYFFSSCDKAWRGTWKNVEILKPIEKPMREYLNKLEDGTYKLVLLDSVADGVDGLIEVPDGSDIAFQAFSNSPVVFKRSECGYSNAVIVWQRETLNDKVASAEVARKLGVFVGAPFSDLLGVNFEADGDAVKHPHYKKDISHLDTLDIYRVTELFNPHSCGAHIAKKALCSGQRGHKDLLTDIQDIIDTAERWKEMLIEDGNP